MWSSKLALTALTLLSHFSECSASAHSSVYLGKLLTRTADVRSEYDYVVVGGGTAGLTVADRLTEDGRCKFERLQLDGLVVGSKLIAATVRFRSRHRIRSLWYFKLFNIMYAAIRIS